jgi:5'-nucleotidase, C-terminal domain
LENPPQVSFICKFGLKFLTFWWADISFNDLVTSQPFQNTIDTIELQGKDIVELMEMAASRPLYKVRKSRFNDGKGCFQVSGMLTTKIGLKGLVQMLIFCQFGEFISVIKRKYLIQIMLYIYDIKIQR